MNEKIQILLSWDLVYFTILIFHFYLLDMNWLIRSTATGNTMVLFFSAEIVLRVWRYLSWENNDWDGSHTSHTVYLHGGVVVAQHLRRVLEGPAGLVLALRRDDLGLGLPRGLSLRCHGALEILWKSDVLDLDPLHLDPPGLGRFVQRGLHVCGDGIPLRQNPTESFSTQNVSTNS